MAIKTRTRNFVKYLKSQFADRFEFFIENAAEGLDIVHVGDRAKFKNFEIHVDYNVSAVKMFGVVVCKSMAEVERFLGRVNVVATDVASFATKKVLKVKKQIENLMRSSNQKKTRMKANEARSCVMSFSF